MNSRAKTVVLAFSMAAMLAAPFAEAAKLGKSKSFGMKRSAPTQSYQQPMQTPAQPMAPAQQQRKGPGVGTAIAAGAAGAAAGYMLGSAMSGDASSGSSEAGSGMPWGTLALLGLLFAGGMMLFRRRMAGQARMQGAQPAGMPYGAAPMPAPQQPVQFSGVPKIGAGLAGGAGGGFAAAYAQQRLPDGTEVPAFLRQAKATFMHLQSLNSPDNVDEISKYMTPQLFNDIRADILSNSGIADFPQLDCQVIDAVNEDGQFVASVRFTGTVSEDVNAPAVPFSETWHYVKTPGSPRWLLAGIQQD